MVGKDVVFEIKVEFPRLLTSLAQPSQEQGWGFGGGYRGKREKGDGRIIEEEGTVRVENVGLIW